MKVSLDQQIEEVDRELALRRDVYEIAVSKGKMRRAVADYHMNRMKAVRATLDMRQAVQDVNTAWSARTVAPLRFGVGIHTGEVVLSSIDFAQQT